MTRTSASRARAATAGCVVVLLALAPARAAEDPCADPERAGRSHVHVIDNGDPFFGPFLTTICRGDTVEWDNHSDRLHTVTHVTCKRADSRYDDCEFDSVFKLEPGTFFEHTFTAPSRVFDYKCTIHGFTGRIEVLDEAGTLPDLTVTALSIHDSVSPASKRLQATIGNVGTATAPASKVSFQYRNVDGAWIEIGEPAIDQINAGASIQLNQSWLVANKIGDFPVRVVVDPGRNALEADEGNNELLETIPVWLPPGLIPGVAAPDPS